METDELKQAEEQQTAFEKAQRVKAQKVKDMMVGEGFKIIESDLIAESKKLTTELLDAKYLIEMQRLQAEIKAIQKFFDKLAFYASIKG